jgi:hypothetical protein
MPERILIPLRGVARKGQVFMSGAFTIGASGAISTQDGTAECGVVFAQTASEDGRYTGTVYKTFSKLRAPHVQMEGTTDTAFPTTTGSDPQLRNVGTSTFDIQFKRTDTQADTDPASGTVVHWSIIGCI